MIITDKQIKSLGVSADTKVEWVETCLRHKYEYDLPAKISIKKENGELFYNTMPAVMEPLGIAGVKCVNRYPNRVPALDSTILLYDYQNGKLKSILDGNEITAMRTGSVAVHSAELFARKDFSTVAMVGLGNIMYHVAEIFFERYKEKKMTVRLYKFLNDAERFIEKFSSYKNVKFEVFESYDEMFKDADLIFSAVSYAEKDFCSASVYKKGVTIIPIHTRGFMECDLAFDKIFGDDTAHLHEFKYFNMYKSFAEVAAVMAGKADGRTNDDERILVYNIGLAIHDLFFAKKITEIIEG